jgi:hypothetical protein
MGSAMEISSRCIKAASQPLLHRSSEQCPFKFDGIGVRTRHHRLTENIRRAVTMCIDVVCNAVWSHKDRSLERDKQETAGSRIYSCSFSKSSAAAGETAESAGMFTATHCGRTPWARQKIAKLVEECVVHFANRIALLGFQPTNGNKPKICRFRQIVAH